MSETFSAMDKDGRIKNSFNQNWEDRIINKKIEGKLNSGLLINAFLFNFDRVKTFIKRKIFKFKN